MSDAIKIVPRAVQAPSQARHVAQHVRPMPSIVRWLFLLFVLTFPFEATDLGVMTGFLSMTRVLGLLFFGFYLLFYGPLSGSRSLPRVPHAMFWFLAYVAVYVLSLPRIAPEFNVEAFVRLATLLQVLVLFWIASSLLEDEKMARRVLMTFSVACGLFAAAVLLRVPGFAEEVAGGRVTGAGENLNVVGRFMAMAVIIVVHYATRKEGARFWRFPAASVLALTIGLAMIGTGSRGAILAFLAGVSVYLLPYWKTSRGATGIVVAVGAIIGVVYLVASTPEFLERWQESYYEGRLSQREVIFAVSIDMIAERPVLGWGPSEAGHILGAREGTLDWVDTHNVFLHLLVEVGIAGTIPFLVGLWLCLNSAWKARYGPLGLLPLALLMMLLTGSLSGNTLFWKPQWLILALSVAASRQAAKLPREARVLVPVYRKAANYRAH